MKKSLILFIVLFSIKSNSQEFHNDMLLAKLKQNLPFSISFVTNKSGQIEIKTNIRKIDSLNAKYKCKKLKHLFTNDSQADLERWLKFEFEIPADFDNLFNSYDKLTDYFEIVEKYPIPIVGYEPNDPLIEEVGCKALYDSKFPEAWDIQTGSSSVTVGVIDLGLDWSHPDISVNNLFQNLNEDYDGDGHTLEVVGGTLQLDPFDLNGIDDDGNGRIDDLTGWDFLDDDNTVIPSALTDDHGLNIT